MPLRDLIVLTSHSQASLRRDKIFALLGVSIPVTRLHFSVNYSGEVSDTDIFISVSVYFLQKSLDSLRFAGLCRLHNGPSWGVDWTAFSRMSTYQRREESLPTFDATEDWCEKSGLVELKERHGAPPSRNRRIEFEPPLNSLSTYQRPTAILLQGFQLDRVSAVMHIPDSSEMQSKTRSTRIMPVLNEWLNQILSDSEWSQGERHSTALRELTSYVRKHWSINLGPTELFKAYVLYVLSGTYNSRYSWAGNLPIWWFSHEKFHSGGASSWLTLLVSIKDDTYLEFQKVAFSDVLKHLKIGDREEWLDNAISSLHAGKTLFGTEKDLYFRMSCDVKQDDLIYWIYGTGTQFLLRRKSDNAFILLSEVYYPNKPGMKDEHFYATHGRKEIRLV